MPGFRAIPEVKALALRKAFDDVDEDDVCQAGLGDPLGGGGAHIAGADDGDLVAGHPGGLLSANRRCVSWHQFDGPA